MVNQKQLEDMRLVTNLGISILGSMSRGYAWVISMKSLNNMRRLGVLFGPIIKYNYFVTSLMNVGS